MSRFRRRNAKSVPRYATSLSFYKRENIIAAFFLYVSKNADVGNEPSRGIEEQRDKEGQEEGAEERRGVSRNESVNCNSGLVVSSFS